MNTAKWNAKVISREEQHEQKRMAVLTAGVQLFNSKGYDRTSLDDIADALNITKRTIYYYVQNKNEILFECMRLGLSFADDIVRRNNDTKLPPLDRIRNLIGAYIEWAFTDFGACLALLQDSTLSEERRRDLHKSKATLDHHLRGLISEGIESGDIRPCDPRLTAAAIFGAINWLPHWNPGGRVVPASQIVPQFIDLFIHALQTESPAPSLGGDGAFVRRPD